MTRTEIEDAVRSWLVAAGAPGGLANPDRAVIIADQDAPRPPLPYLMVRVTLYDSQVGQDEDLVDAASPPSWRARGQRTGTVSVHAFGAGAEDWLQRAVSQLGAPSVRTLLDASGLAIRPAGDAENLSALLDDRTQVHFHRDFFVDYVQEGSGTDTEAGVELEQVTHEDHFESSSPDERVVTVTEVV